MNISRRGVNRLVSSMLALPWFSQVLAQTSTQPGSTVYAPTLPTEAFAQIPAMRGVSLAPDGSAFAAFVNLDDATILVTRSLAAGSKFVSILKSDNIAFHFNWLHWVSSDRLVFSMRSASSRNQVAVEETRLASVKRDGTELVYLNHRPSRNGSIYDKPYLQIQDRVVDWLPDDGQNILVALAEGPDLLPAVFKVNVVSGFRTLITAPQKDVYSWLTDKQSRVRIGTIFKDDQTDIIERMEVGQPWRTLWSFKRGTDTEVWPLGFGSNPQELWVNAWKDGHLAVFTVDLSQPGFPLSLKFAKKGEDVDQGLMRSVKTGDVVGLQSGVESGSDDQRDAIWDTDLKTMALSIDKQLPGRINRLYQFSRDEQTYLLYSSGNGRPGRYFVGNRSRGELALLSETYPRLMPDSLVGKESVRIVARDGLPLNAYLTRPKGARAEVPLPMILLPHGGPGSRDDNDFDYWTEFLANRGYAVLQVNFRGSDGMGLEHKKAGSRRWGMEMQDDLTDATNWAIAQKIADPKRIAIVGASYGGYAALMGAVKTPDLYRCAVSFAGVTDLPELILGANRYVGGTRSIEAQLGSYTDDREKLKATSPLEQASRIRVPVLLVHGTADRVVPSDQSKSMASALSRAGKTHKYVELDGGDHYLSRYAHRLEFFKTMEAFLSQNMKPA